MDSSAAGFFAILFALGAIVILAALLAVAAGAALLTTGIVLLVKRRRRILALQKAEYPAFCTAAVADMRCFQRMQQKGGMQNEFDYALHFTGEDGMQHRAFLAIITPLSMNLQVGYTVSVAVFSEPLIEPSVSALDPYRGMDGRLPEFIETRTWLDVPVDETGTVMLADDYQRAVGRAKQKNKTALIVGWILLGITGLRLLAVLLMYLSRL